MCYNTLYRIIILPLVLNGREIWSLTLKREHSVKAFKNGMRGKIFGPEEDQVAGSREKCLIWNFTI
jgi:hypothetical protein